MSGDRRCDDVTQQVCDENDCASCPVSPARPRIHEHPSELIGLLAGYLVEWNDDEGTNDIFFKEEEHANWRAREVRACGFGSVKVTTMYRQRGN